MLPAHAYALARTVPIFVESAVLCVRANIMDNSYYTCVIIIFLLLFII